jgi:chorismate mutase/prephenate dehydratase
LPIYSPEREAEILKKIVKENKGPLEDKAVKRIFKLIIKETRKLEREVEKNGGRNETGGN